jgi:hypothetical protein
MTTIRKRKAKTQTQRPAVPRQKWPEDFLTTKAAAWRRSSIPPAAHDTASKPDVWSAE